MVLLLLNDAWLKPAFSNWWTGKLSDFAGLYALPIFLTALRPQSRRAAFCLTAVGFMLWKSPLSDGVVAAWNRLDIWPVTRVVDYTDWIALLSLPLAFRAVSSANALLPGSSQPWAWVRGVSTAVIAIFAFAATSRARHGYTIQPAQGYWVAGSRQGVSDDLRASGLRRVSGPYARPADPGPDTLAYELALTHHSWVMVTLELRPADCGVVLTPVAFASNEKNVDRAELRDSLLHQLVEPLRARYSECPVSSYH